MESPATGLDPQFGLVGCHRDNVLRASGG
jgi:hypothetical protein